MAKEDQQSTVAVRLSTKLRMIQHKLPKKNRQKGEHILETVDTLINRLMDFYDEHSPSVK